MRAAHPEAARRRGLPGVRERRRRRAGRAEGAMLSRAGIRARPGLGLLQVRGMRAAGEGTGRTRGVPTWGRCGAGGAGRRGLGWGHRHEGDGVGGLGSVEGQLGRDGGKGCGGMQRAVGGGGLVVPQVRGRGEGELGRDGGSRGLWVNGIWGIEEIGAVCAAGAVVRSWAMGAWRGERDLYPFHGI